MGDGEQGQTWRRQHSCIYWSDGDTDSHDSLSLISAYIETQNYLVYLFLFNSRVIKCYETRLQYFKSIRKSIK